MYQMIGFAVISPIVLALSILILCLFVLLLFRASRRVKRFGFIALAFFFIAYFAGTGFYSFLWPSIKYRKQIPKVQACLSKELGYVGDAYLWDGLEAGGRDGGYSLISPMGSVKSAFFTRSTNSFGQNLLGSLKVQLDERNFNRNESHNELSEFLSGDFTIFGALSRTLEEYQAQYLNSWKLKRIDGSNFPTFGGKVIAYEKYDFLKKRDGHLIFVKNDHRYQYVINCPEGRGSCAVTTYAHKEFLLRFYVPKNRIPDIESEASFARQYLNCTLQPNEE